MAEYEDILDSAVDAGWAHRTKAPPVSFSGALRVAARTAIELYKKYVEKESERNAELKERVGVLEKTLTQIGYAVRLSFDHKLPLEDQVRILNEVRMYMNELNQVKAERSELIRSVDKLEEAAGIALALLQNKEHLRKRFRGEAHWIRFIREVRSALQEA